MIDTATITTVSAPSDDILLTDASAKRSRKCGPALNVAEKVVGVSQTGHMNSHAAIAILEDVSIIMEDNLSTRSKRSLDNIRRIAEQLQCGGEFLKQAAGTANDDVKAVNKAMLLRESQAREQRLVQEGLSDNRKRSKKKSPSLEVVEKYSPVQPSPLAAAVTNGNVTVADAQLSSPPVIPTRRILPRRSEQPSSRRSELPSPRVGSMYTPAEAMEVMHSFTNMSRTDRAALKKDMIELELVPVQLAALNRFYKKHKDKKLPPPDRWNKRGGKHIVLVDDILQLMIKKLESHTDSSWKRNDTARALIAARRDYFAAKGVDTRGRSLLPCDETVHSYHTALMVASKGKLSKKAVFQPWYRATAEKSWRSVISHIIGVAVAHTIVGTTPANRGVPDTATDGAKDLNELIREAEGGADIYAVLAALITSKDQFRVHTMEGEGTGPPELVIALCNSTGKTHATHQDGDGAKDKFTGVTMEGTSLTSMDGRMAPAWFTIKVKESELPRELCADGVIVLPVKGLCVGGAVDSFADQVGYICVARDDAKVDELICKEHWKRVHEPFLKKQREEEGMPETEGEHVNVSPLHRSVNWNDGGIPWLRAMVEENLQEGMAGRQEIQGKHARNNSLTHQPADLAASFRIFKGKNKRKRKRGSKAGSKRMGKKFREALATAKQKYGLVLGTNKIKSLVDFVERLPGLLQDSYSAEVIEESFKANGMADRGSVSYPDLYAMLDTIKCEVPDNFVDDLLIPNFSLLYKEMKDTGMISEATFEALGVPEDTDNKGDTVPMTAGINREWGQRCKIVSCPAQRQLRREEEAASDEVLRISWEREKDNRASVLRLNRDAEKKLHALRERPETSSRNRLVDVTLTDLFSLSAPEVKAFVHVRTCTKYRKRGEYKFASKKGTVEDAKACLDRRSRDQHATLQGIDCNLFRAYELRKQTRLTLKELPSSPPPPQEMENAARSAVVVTAGIDYTSQPAPSTFLDDADWVEMVGRAFEGVELQTVDVEMKERADAVLPFVRQRLWEHKFARIEIIERHNHWSLVFFEENLPRLCAVLALAGHIKTDVKCAKRDTCLLARAERGAFNTVMGGNFENLFGCYLFWDEDEGVFIRSGKAYGASDRTMKGRLKDHKKGSECKALKDRESTFHASYPCKEKGNVGDNVRRGFFQNLVMYVGLGFREGGSTADLVARQDGVFMWSDSCMENTQKASFNGASTTEKKQLHMVAYATELMYDLLISPSKNVSESPGFEAVLGLFGGGATRQ